MKTVVIGLAAILGTLLSVALTQNLRLRNSNRKLLERLHETPTDQVNFPRAGSFLFAAFSWLLTSLLWVLTTITLF